jgi:conjugal transfer/entry exclusion protein
MTSDDQHLWAAAHALFAVHQLYAAAVAGECARQAMLADDAEREAYWLAVCDRAHELSRSRGTAKSSLN